MIEKRHLIYPLTQVSLYTAGQMTDTQMEKSQELINIGSKLPQIVLDPDIFTKGTIKNVKVHLENHFHLPGHAYWYFTDMQYEFWIVKSKSSMSFGPQTEYLTDDEFLEALDDRAIGKKLLTLTGKQLGKMLFPQLGIGDITSGTVSQVCFAYWSNSFDITKEVKSFYNQLSENPAQAISDGQLKLVLRRRKVTPTENYISENSTWWTLYPIIDITWTERYGTKF